ncbi:H+/gluconate symporter-like permease [Clostridium tetanomorphum]|nr:GntP family permease [Clostridium tetanomorphum]KAJ49025.1 integral membrane permease [Clostridium tetanomorphum DSM 665]KAJ52179.1 integral membrane permease [Clostridium tetanomorphum DSM 665]MBP1866424.1 H+/gluconate symporter-like permease [Clostridium tetanomorphum]NRS86774.1 H+/gluconate symporter-like permease [Clostridium tetanomorphum]NRZ99471.1 H+/gluconate symporter-like permease [Clostridium tetanomorphum]
MLGVIGIIISLVLLMYLAYRGITVLILAPVLALLAVLFSGDLPLLVTYTEIFMKDFAGYAKTYFPLFLLGAVFGKVMDDSGAAKSIANFIANKLGKDKAILAVVLSCAVLTYGGVSLFVVAFAVYPIAVELFKEANLPKRLVPGSIALGAFTFTMTALPGSPQIQNAIPMTYFGTTAWAAPVLGVIASIVMFTLGMMWLNGRAKKAAAAGEGYGNHKEEKLETLDESKLPNIFVAIAPIVVVLVLNYILGRYFGNMPGEYLKKYGTSVDKVKGLWSLIVALIISIVLAIILMRKNFKSVIKTINDGAIGSLLAIANTSSEVGYGNVIKALGAFALIKSAILAIPGTPLISLSFSTSILAGITGSASGGMSIALGALGDIYMQKAVVLGINPEAFHRIAAIACGGFDTLPHNGAVITLLGITGLTHKESYVDIGMCTVIIPVAATIVCIIAASFGIV